MDLTPPLFVGSAIMGGSPNIESAMTQALGNAIGNSVGEQLKNVLKALNTPNVSVNKQNQTSHYLRRLGPAPDAMYYKTSLAQDGVGSAGALIPASDLNLSSPDAAFTVTPRDFMESVVTPDNVPVTSRTQNGNNAVKSTAASSEMSLAALITAGKHYAEMAAKGSVAQVGSVSKAQQWNEQKAVAKDWLGKGLGKLEQELGLGSLFSEGAKSFSVINNINKAKQIRDGVSLPIPVDKMPHYEAGKEEENQTLKNIDHVAIGTGIYLGKKEFSKVSGDYWFGQNGKKYKMTWGGNQYTGARKLAVDGAELYHRLGIIPLIVDTLINGVDVVKKVQEGYHGEKGAYFSAVIPTISMGMGIYGYMGGPWAFGISVGYTLVEEKIGWANVINKASDMSVRMNVGTTRGIGHAISNAEWFFGYRNAAINMDNKVDRFAHNLYSLYGMQSPQYIKYEHRTTLRGIIDKAAEASITLNVTTDKLIGHSISKVERFLHFNNAAEKTEINTDRAIKQIYQAYDMPVPK